MTVSDPGAGQQQGQEVGWSGAELIATEAVELLERDDAGEPPARDSGRDEAREAVARWLWEQDGYAGSWEREDQQHYYREHADRLLALPKLDKLLRRPA